MFREKSRNLGRIFEKLGCSFGVKATSLDFFVDLGKRAGQRRTSHSTAEMGDITGTKGAEPLRIPSAADDGGVLVRNAAPVGPAQT
jgi:hypothetical protein